MSAVTRAGHSDRSINVGDVAVWHAPDQETPAYVVWGTSAAGAFSSSSLRGDAFYSHAFDEPGDIEWTGTGDGAPNGRIRVRAFDGSQSGALERWRRLVREGTVMTVEGGRVEPAEVDVVVGQTVFIAVNGSDGLTITAKRRSTGAR